MVSPNSGDNTNNTTNTTKTTTTKVPDVYILMGPVSTGKSTALKCIKEKLNPLKVMVACGDEYKSKFFYPIFPLGFSEHSAASTTINGITSLQVGAYYTLLMAVNDAMKTGNIDVVIMETALTPHIGQPLLDSPMVKKFVFIDAEDNNMIIKRRIQRDYINKDIICTETDKVNIIKSAQNQSKDYLIVMNDAKSQGKLAAGSNNDIVLIKESHTPNQVADMIISNVEEWHQYIV
jgi:guanylate kinase